MPNNSTTYDFQQPNRNEYEYQATVTVNTYRVDSRRKEVTRGRCPKNGGWLATIENSNGDRLGRVPPPEGRRFFQTEEEAHEAGEEALNRLFGYVEEIG